MASKQINIFPAVAASGGCTASCESYFTGTGQIGFGPSGSQYEYTNYQLVATAASGWAVDRVVYHRSWSASDGTSGTETSTTRNIDVNPFYQPETQVFTTYEWPGDFHKISGGDFPVHTTSREITSVDVYFKTGPTPPPGVKVVTAYASPSDGGTVQVGSAESGASSSQAVETGGSINIVATAGSGYAFKGWYQNNVLVSSSATYTVQNVTADQTFEARFVPVHTITVATYASVGSVSINGTWTPTGSSGFGQMSMTFEVGETITIGARPKDASLNPFKAWYLNPSAWGNPENTGTLVAGAGDTYTITVSSDATYFATFHRPTGVSLSVTSDSGGYGTPDVSLAINGETTRSKAVPVGSSVTIAAPVDGGQVFDGDSDYWYYFEHWQRETYDEEVVSTDASYTFEANSSIVLQAYYKTYVRLHAEVSPDSSAGEISVSPASQHGDYYAPGGQITLTAIPKPGFIFKKWTYRYRWSQQEVQVSTTSQISLTPSDDFSTRVYVAHFDRTHLLVNSSDLSTPVQLVYDPATNLLVADY